MRDFILPIHTVDFAHSPNDSTSHQLDRIQHAVDALQPALDKAVLAKASVLAVAYARRLGFADRMQRVAALVERFQAGERGFFVSFETLGPAMCPMLTLALSSIAASVPTAGPAVPMRCHRGAANESPCVSTITRRSTRTCINQPYNS